MQAQLVAEVGDGGDPGGAGGHVAQFVVEAAAAGLLRVQGDGPVGPVGVDDDEAPGDEVPQGGGVGGADGFAPVIRA
ncbi:hypothetical protein GCM10023237_04030 [Streptomyces coeruleoprunus]